MADQLIQTVDVAEVELQLPSLADGSVEELYRFGALMVSSAQQRAVRLDAKLTGVLGWSSAALAFVLVDAGLSKPRGFAFLAILFSISMAAASVATAYFGLRSRLWAGISERDWFRDGLLKDSGTLKRYHVVSMLNIHQSQADGNSKRAAWLRVSEILLGLSATAIFITLLMRVF